MLQFWQVDVTLTDSRGRSALHFAAAAGHSGMLAALDKFSAQYYPDSSLISSADRKGYTPLHWACYFGKNNTC